jgi:multidrug efflux pump subunit AcrA (membrane-fusion protein)
MPNATPSKLSARAKQAIRNPLTRACFASVLAAALLAGCGRAGGGRVRNVAAANPIPTVTAKLATVRATSTISGVIAPLQNVAITSQLAEPADSVAVNEGDRVHPGQVVAVLDTADLRAQLAQDQATVVTDQRTAESDDAKVTQSRYTQRLNIDQGGDQVQSARAALAQANQTLHNDQANLVRDQQLLTNGYVAQQTVDQQVTTVANDRSAVRTAQATVQSALTNQSVNGTNTVGLQAADVASAAADARAAHAVVQQARAAVQQVQTQIAKATIVSPIEGVVVNRNLNPGEYPGARTIFTLQQLNNVYAELNASSADTFAIPIGAPVTMSVSGSSGASYSGRVVAVLGQVTPGSTNFTVKVLVSNPDEKLQSGIPVTAVASLPPVTGVGIPTSAFLDETHTTVMVADDELVDTVAKTVHVRELGSNATTSIVSGIKAGQSVVSNGQLGVTDGQSLAQE